jgi:hypothetical protein
MLIAFAAFAFVAIAAIAVALNALTGSLERPFIYFPSGGVRATPADAGLDYEEVEFVTADAVAIRGWFVPGPSRTTWLWFHGNAGNLGDRVDLIRELHDAVGVSIFIVSYRGYGDSEGSPSEQGLYRDAQAALEYLRSRADVDPELVVYFGRSIGSAVAVDLASREPPFALVLEASFPSLRWLARRVYPWLPVWPFLHEEYEVEAKARSIFAPTLVIHGDRDEIAPVSGGRAVAAALSGEVGLVVVPEAGHNDLPRVAGADYYRWISAFLERAERSD